MLDSIAQALLHDSSDVTSYATVHLTHSGVDGPAARNVSTSRVEFGPELKTRAMPRKYPDEFRISAIALVRAGFSAKRACHVLGVSRQGYYRCRHRPMSPTMMRREWPTALIRQVHAESRRTYGSRRVRAELIQGRGIGVSE